MLACRCNSGMENKTLIPLNRIARVLSVPVRWLIGEAEGGRIPAVQAGGRWLSTLTAVEKALLARLPGDGGKGAGDAK